MNFEEFSLDGRLNAGIRDVGYETPTPIQEQAIPPVLEGRDVMGLAQTGTGKTAAFALPILQRLTRGPLRRTRALIVAPTRELAEQIHQSFRQLGKHTKVRSTAVYGGVGKAPQINALKSGVEIVVACPGRLLDLAGEGHINLSHVEVLVLDEADRMCDMGFLPDIKRILKLLPTERQTLFFSATMPPDIRRLSSDILKDPVTVQIGIIAPAETVSHALFPITNNMRKSLLLSMLRQTATGRVLIFTRTKRRARFLARDLEKKGYNATALQGNMSQNKRQKAINGFRNGKYDILVATDVASRGIDVDDISHVINFDMPDTVDAVINFDMPDTVDAYTHRIGRTGRKEESGEAFTLATPDDAAQVRAIEKLLGQPIERRRLSDFNYGEFRPESQFQNNGHNGSSRNGNANGRRYNNGRNRRSGGNKRNNRPNHYRPRATT
jgi:ATP-dependent RNA helicase RhlE